MSLGLAIIFWILSTKQANDAKKTLDDIKTQIITWQVELNKAAINIILARPEVIAKETAIEESKTLSEFSDRFSILIEKAALQATQNELDGDRQLKVLAQLLDHHKNLILGKQQLVNQAIAMQAGHIPANSKASQSN